MGTMPARRSSEAAGVSRYGVALAMVGLAWGARELIGPAESGLQFVTFFPAVALAAVYGGFRAGMLATAVAAALATFLYIPPYRAFSFDFHATTIWSNLAFFLDELMVCGAIQAMHNHYRNFRVASERLGENHNLLTAIVEGTTDAVFLKDAAGRYLYSNAAHLHLTGRKLDEIVGRDAYAIYPAEQARALTERDRAVMAAGKIENYEEELTLPQGEKRSFLTTKGPIFDAGGNIKGLFGIARDITARKTTEDALMAAKTEAERANKAKSRFLAAASHDLRQPLSALSLYVGVLGNKLAPDDGRLLANMKDCVASLNEMLSNLLDLSKLEAGVVTPNVSDFAVDDVLAQVISSHAPEAKLKGLGLRCACFGLTARTDRMLFQRMIGNLVANAVRYTRQGGVLVGCRRRQGRMWVEVWDTGIGIPADKTAEIFEEFKQLDNHERNRAKGSGLGLAIVARTATLLGLQIRVQSRLGRGSLFAVEMPLGLAFRPVAEREYTHRPLRIALVEDNLAVAEALAYALKNSGHQVVAAASCRELLSRIDGVRPDIVISDYRLAGKETGFEVITSVRAAFGNSLPAVIITGDTDPQLLRSMADKGIRVHHKPLELEALRASIAELTALDPGQGQAVACGAVAELDCGAVAELDCGAVAELDCGAVAELD
ncbi:MAG: hypothetical protein A2045_07230 [Rhodocyclales bacterium GWA2_65_20]|nr:MAG: hypothetical protein A2045_07230 [Rhodocyclales bacterium GWA2_65_20]